MNLPHQSRRLEGEVHTAIVTRQEDTLDLVAGDITLVVPHSAERALRIAKTVTIIEGDGDAARVLGNISITWDM